MFLKPLSAVWKLLMNWVLFIYTQTPLVHQLITLSSKTSPDLNVDPKCPSYVTAFLHLHCNLELDMQYSF